MKSLFKGVFLIISIVCIAFSAFFVYSYATGNTRPITIIEMGIAKVAGTKAKDSESTVTMLTKQYGLSTTQATHVVDIASDLGVDVNDSAEVNAFVLRNIGNAEEIKSIAAELQAGEITEAQAKTMLASILDV